MQTVDDVIALYQRWGRQHYDDLVSQLDHGLQCAALGASTAGAPAELIAASLLHDLGHLLELEASNGRIGDLGIDRRHEATAARVLAGLFPSGVTAPIALHVEAKRYLCAVDDAYLSLLSDGSVRSLATQGGPMDDAARARFEALPAHRGCVRSTSLGRSGQGGRTRRCAARRLRRLAAVPRPALSLRQYDDGHADDLCTGPARWPPVGHLE